LTIKVISAVIVSLISIWVNYKNRIYSSRKDHMVRSLFLVNQVITTVLQKKGEDRAFQLDEIRTIFALFGTKQERVLEIDIAKMLTDNPYGSGTPFYLKSRRKKYTSLYMILLSKFAVI